MAFHSDTLNSDNRGLEQTRLVTSGKIATAIIATVGFLAVVQPTLTVLLGASVVTSLSLTFVSVLQAPENWSKSTPKLDAIYAVLVGMMIMVSFQVAAGSLIGAAILLIGAIVAELVISAFIAAGISSLNGIYQAPIAIALNIHSRFFGLLGRAV